MKSSCAVGYKAANVSYENISVHVAVSPTCILTFDVVTPRFSCGYNCASTVPDHQAGPVVLHAVVPPAVVDHAVVLPAVVDHGIAVHIPPGDVPAVVLPAVVDHAVVAFCVVVHAVVEPALVLPAVVIGHVVQSSLQVVHVSGA